MNDIGLKVFHNAYKSVSTGTIVVDEIARVPVVFSPCGSEHVNVTIDGKVYNVSRALLEFTAPIIAKIIKDASSNIKVGLLGEI